jgi:hypothetical protein
MSWSLLLVLVAAAGPVAPPAPRAGSPAQSGTVLSEEAARKQARGLVAEAQGLYARKRYAEAAARFERAYALKPVPAILFNMARCYDKLMDTPRALRAYRDYLRAAPEASDVAEVQASILVLEKRLRAMGLSQLLVLTDPPGARVRMNGKELGESPVSAELVTGKYDVSLRLEGHAPVDSVVEVTLEKSSVLSVMMKPLPADPPRAREDVSSRGEGGLSLVPVEGAAPGLPPSVPPEALAVGRHAGDVPPRTGTWIGAGATGAVLLAGVACFAAAHWNADQLVKDETMNKALRNTFYDNARGLETASRYVFLGALVPAAATGVLFAFGK